MLLCFSLSMPGNNAWNGKWSGEGRGYFVVRNMGNAQKTRTRFTPIIGHSFGYNFGDGWFASVAVEEVSAKEAAKFRKASSGFCGYNWMIDEIIDLGRIRTLDERTRKEPANAKN